MDIKLIFKKLNNALTKEEEIIFNKWLAESKDHQAYFDQIKSNKKASISETVLENDWQKIAAKITTKKSRNNYWKYAVAASILLVVSIAFFNKNIPEKEKFVTNESTILIGTDKARLTLEDGSNIDLEDGTSISTERFETDGKHLVYNSKTTSKNEEQYNFLTTPSGGEFNVELADGTIVWLNANSKLKYPVAFTEGKRIKHHHTLERALIWELGFSPQIFDIDGVVYYNADWVPMNRIISVYVVTGSQGTMRWGGPVVIVSTMDSPEEIAKRREAKAEQYRNQNYYVEDSVERPDDAIVTASTQSDKPAQKSIDVYGKVTYENQPLSNVNIKILDSPRGTNTDENGQYNIKTKAGDELRFSYVGLHTVTVIIEDVTAEINIEMVSSANSLDEVVVTAKTAKGSLIERSNFESLR